MQKPSCHLSVVDSSRRVNTNIGRSHKTMRLRYFSITQSGSNELLSNQTRLVSALLLFFCSCMRHQLEGAKDSCHRARSSEPYFRSVVTLACFTCHTSLASRPPPHSGEHAKSSRVCRAEAFLHIPHICLWFTEQVTSPACLNSCFGDDAAHLLPPNCSP